MAKRLTSPVAPTVTVIGSGEAFDSGLGNTSYLLRGKGLPTMLFDCGYQIPERLWAAGLHTKLEAVCFTHLHADHSFGIVPLLVRFAEEGRKKPLYILGPRGTDRFVPRLLDMGYPGFAKRIAFDIRYLTLSTSTAIAFQGLRLSCARTVHSVLNFTIRVDLPKRIASFAVSGDGQITTESKRLVSDVDVLFQEIYSEEPGIPVHADLHTIREWIPETRIKKLVASHFARSSKVGLSKRVRSLPAVRTQWIASSPGLEVSI